MKKTWPTKPIGEACPLSSRKPVAFMGGRPYYSTGAVGPEGELSEPELVDFANRPTRAGCMPAVGDVGFARMKGTKKVILVDESVKGALFSTGFCFLAPGQDVDPRFAFYFITSEGFQGAKDGVAGDGIMGGIKNADAAAIEMPLPPLAEQRRIVGLLDEACESLATAKVNAERNLRNAHALFESHLQSVFAQRGPGWVETTLSRATGGILTGPFGSVLHKSDYVLHGIPLVNPAHITHAGIEPDARKTVSKETARRLKNYIMSKGDIVFGRRGEMGRCALVTDREDGWLCGTGSFVIKPSGRCDARFLVRLLRSEGCRARLEKIAGGAVMPNLSNTDLGNLVLDLPPLDRQIAIVEQCDAISEVTQRLAGLYERKLAALEAMKKSLLQEAFSGAL